MEQGQHGQSVPQQLYYPDLRAGGQHYDQRHAGLCAEPVQVPRQQADPQPVHHCHPDPRHRLSGHGVPDHDCSASGKLPARLHHPDDGHGRYHHLYLFAVLREPFSHAGRKRHSGWLHLLWCVLQDPAAPAEARHRHQRHPEGCVHLQRILHGKPVSAG